MYLSAVPGLLRIFMPSNLEWQIKTDKKEIFITFDDGPIPEVTPWVLDMLEKYLAKATFFCVGDNVQKHPDVYRQIIQRGHAVGNHTFNHLQAWKTPNKEYIENVAQFRSLIDSRLFRPPHGQISRSLAKELGKDYRLIMWSVLSRDFDQELIPDKCFEIARKGTQPGSIIVFHDSLKAWKRLEYALPAYLEHFSRVGYIFSALK
jgi:peptidoglycan-N-acetylglucosamine deacetylase